MVGCNLLFNCIVVLYFVLCFLLFWLYVDFFCRLCYLLFGDRLGYGFFSLLFQFISRSLFNFFYLFLFLLLLLFLFHQHAIPHASSHAIPQPHHTLFDLFFRLFPLILY